MNWSTTALYTISLEEDERHFSVVFSPSLSLSVKLMMLEREEKKCRRIVTVNCRHLTWSNIVNEQNVHSGIFVLFFDRFAFFFHVEKKNGEIQIELWVRPWQIWQSTMTFEHFSFVWYDYRQRTLVGVCTLTCFINQTNWSTYTSSAIVLSLVISDRKRSNNEQLFISKMNESTKEKRTQHRLFFKSFPFWTVRVCN